MVSEQLQMAINANTGGGWEFYQLTDVNIEVSPGCLGMLFGGSVSYVTFDQIVFRRLKSE